MDVPEELRQLSYRLLEARELLIDVERRAEFYRSEAPEMAAASSHYGVTARNHIDRARDAVAELRARYG